MIVLLRVFGSRASDLPALPLRRTGVPAIDTSANYRECRDEELHQGLGVGGDRRHVAGSESSM